MDTKTCTKCSEAKAVSEFGYSRPGVLRGNCKKCQQQYNKDYLKGNPDKARAFNENRLVKAKQYRKKNKVARNDYLKEWGKKNPEKKRGQKYRNRYGIDIKDYDALLEKQGGKCAICRSKDFGRSGAKHFLVDHCHETGCVRGLLCHRCNMGIGYLNDSKKILVSAINYLKDAE